MAKKKSDKAKYQVTMDSSVMSLCMLVYNETLVWSYGSNEEKDCISDYQKSISDIKDSLSSCTNDVQIANLSDEMQTLVDKLNSYCTEVVEAKHYDEILYSLCEGIDVDEYQASCIQHRSKSNDDFFTPHEKKIHYHIIARRTSHPFKRTQPRRVSTFINLFGLEFRSGIDNNVVEHFHTCSVDSSSCDGNTFAEKLLYQTHETDAAIKAGKERYEYEDLHNNFSRDVYDLICQGYSGSSEPKKLSLSAREELRNKAFNLGLDGKNYSLLFVDCKSARYDSHEKVFRQSYEDGVNARLGNHFFVPRICLFIQGVKGLGKSACVSYALDQMGYDGGSISFVTNVGNGKFDGIDCDTRAIVLDDVSGANLLALFGEYECKLKARYTSAIWQGDFVCVTSNKTFKEWCNMDGSDDADTSVNAVFDALESRIAVCHVETYDDKAPRLILDNIPQNRLNQKGWDSVQDKYIKFFLSFNKKLEELYNQGSGSVERQYSKEFLDAVGGSNTLVSFSQSKILLDDGKDPFVEPSGDLPF